MARQPEGRLGTRRGPWVEQLFRVFGSKATRTSSGRQVGVYSKARNAIRVLPENESPFGEALVVQRRTSISINSAYGLSLLRQGQTVTGSGSIDDTTQPGSILVKSGATAGSTATLNSSEAGRYAPGFAAEVGIGIRPQGTLAGTAVFRWGGRSPSGDDGFYFEESVGDVIDVVRLKGGSVVERKPNDEWNLDRLDGSDGDLNPSGITLDTSKGYIWQVDFTWYGYGIILFGIVKEIPEDPAVQHFIPCHVFSVDDTISIEEPNLQIFAEVDNGDQATDYTLEVGGMQYSIVGNNDGARKRVVDDFRLDTNTTTTTPTPIVSFRRKSSFLNRSVELRSLTNIVESEIHLIEVWVGGTVTGGEYETPDGYDPDEVSIESNRTATSFSTTGAVLVYRSAASPGQANKPGSSDNPVVDLDLPDGLTLTMTARTITGTGAVTLGLMRIEEGW